MGLWSSFLLKDNDTGSLAVNDRTYTFLEHYGFPTELKTSFVSVAKRELPLKIEQKYADVVVECLSGLENGMKDADDRQDSDGVQGDLRNIDIVPTNLQEIVL